MLLGKAARPATAPLKRAVPLAAALPRNASQPQQEALLPPYGLYPAASSGGGEEERARCGGGGQVSPEPLLRTTWVLEVVLSGTVGSLGLGWTCA